MLNNKTSFFPLIKRELHSFLINPILYVACAFFLFSNAINFFYGNRFFIENVGSSDVRFFFEFFPVACVFVIPALTMNLWTKADTESIAPVYCFQIVLAKWFATLIILMSTTIASLCIIFVIAHFGTINFSVVIASIIGLAFLFSSLCSFGLLCSVLFRSSTVSFFITAIALALFTFNESIASGNYFESNTINVLIRFFSFSYSFNSFSKGIIDSRNILFFICTTILFLSSSSLVVELRKYSKTSKSNQKKYLRHVYFVGVALISLILLHSQLSHTRFDLTENRAFSLSDYSKDLANSLESNVLITYYLSPELIGAYSTTRDVEDFLYEYSDYSENIQIKVRNPNSDSIKTTLKNLGIEELDIPTYEQNKTTVVKAYSAIVVEYNNRIETIPFLIDTSTLEYDIAGRLLSLMGSLTRSAFIVVGNSYSLLDDYPLVVPFLEASGFATRELHSDDLLQTSNLDTRTPIVLLGSSMLTVDHVQALQTFIQIGGKVFFSVSPIDINLDTWEAQFDPSFMHPLFQYLETKGINVQPKLIHDSKNFQTTLLSQSGDTQHIHYPFFIDIAPIQSNQNILLGKTFKGISALWPSPIDLQGSLQEIAHTSSTAWLQTSNQLLFNQGRSAFITNPFFEDNLKLDTETHGNYSIATIVDESMVLISDQYFLSRGIAYIEQRSAIRNFDFLVNSLLWLQGNYELLDIKTKAFIDYSLHSFEHEDTFKSTQQRAILLLSIWYCIACLVPYIILRIKTYIHKQNANGVKHGKK